MNTIFNVNRLGLLLKRFFIENKQRELSFWAISLVVFMLLRNSTAVSVFIIVSGFIFAARTYSIFKYTPGGIHYLMIPTTHFEKLVTSIILSIFYFLSAVLITYVIGNTIGTYAGNMIFGLHDPVHFELFNLGNNSIQYSGNDVDHSLFGLFLSFAISQSLFILGSIYFRKNAVGRTFLSMIALTTVLIIIEVLFLKVAYGSVEIQTHNIHLTNDAAQKLFQSWITVWQIGKYCAIPFLWVVSYFRLTEKEV